MKSEVVILKAVIVGMIVGYAALALMFLKTRTELQTANEVIATWQQSGQNWHDHLARMSAEKARN